MALYGLGSPHVTYEQFVLLWLNLERVRALDCLSTVRALRIAGGEEETPPEWITILASTPEEASRWRQWELKRSLRRERR